MQSITSSFLSLNIQDFLKGLIMTIGCAVFAIIAESCQKGQFIFDFTAIWHTGLAAGVVYLSKQFFTPAKAITPIQ
jgi:hypothetical protein